MFFLGGDPSLRSPGVGAVREGQLVVARSLTIGDSLRGAKRLQRIHEELMAFGRELAGPCQGTAVEGPSLGSTHREYDLGEGSGVLKRWLYTQSETEPMVVAPTQLKLFATGHAQASKEAVWAYVRDRFGQEVDGDDASDAAVLAEIAWCLGTQSRPRTRAQAEVLHALKNPRPLVRRTRGREKQV